MVPSGLSYISVIYEQYCVQKQNYIYPGFSIFSYTLTFCSVAGFGAVVERNLDVEITGFDRYGELIKINASGWQARILQHECDHLDGILYVDKMVPRTFRTERNINMPLVHGCPKLGPRG